MTATRSPARELIEGLGVEDTAERERVARDLIAQGAAGLEAIVSACVEARVATAASLAASVPLATRCSALAQSLGAASTPEIARAAAVALLLLDPEGHPHLVEAATSGGAMARAAALWALALDPAREDSLETLLLAALTSADVEARVAAAEGFCRLPAAAERARQSLVAALGDGDARVRRQALRALGSSLERFETLHESVAPLLEDEDVDVRLAAASIVTVGAPADERLAAFFARLGEIDDPGLRIQAMQLVPEAQLGGDTAPRLLAHQLEDEAPSVRAAAARLLGHLGAHAGSFVPSLARALDDDSAEVTLAALRALTALGPRLARGGADHILDLLDWEVGEAQMLAARLLVALDRGAEARQALLALLADEDASLRGSACRTLAGTWERDEEIVAAIEGLLADEDANVRIEAALALNELGVGDDRTEQLIALGLCSERDSLRSACAMQLVGIRTPLAREVFIEALASKRDAVREHAARAFTEAAASDPETLAALHGALDDDSVAVRRAAVARLSRLIGDGVVTEPLPARLLGDPDPTVALEAARSVLEDESGAQSPHRDRAVEIAIGALDSADEAHVNLALELLSSAAAEDRNAFDAIVDCLADLRAGVATLAGEIVSYLGERGVARLVEALGDERGRVRMRALGGLADVPELLGDGDLDAIVQRVSDPEPAVRAAALQAVGEALAEESPRRGEASAPGESRFSEEHRKTALSAALTAARDEAAPAAVRAAALGALGTARASDEETREVVLAAVEHPSRAVQAAALSAIVRTDLDLDRSLTAVARTLASRFSEIRVKACAAIENLLHGDRTPATEVREQLAQALAPLVREPDHGVALMAALAATSLGQGDPEIIRAIHRGVSPLLPPHVRGVAIRGLTRLAELGCDTEETRTILTTLIQDRDTRIRVAAAHALSESAAVTPAQVGRILEALQDERAHEAMLALADALVRHAPEDRSTVKAVVSCLKRVQDRDTLVRLLTTLSRTGEEVHRAGSAVAALLEHADPQVRMVSGWLLASRTHPTPEVASALVQALLDLGAVEDQDAQIPGLMGLFEAEKRGVVDPAAVLPLLSHPAQRVAELGASVLLRAEDVSEEVIAALIAMLGDGSARHPSLPAVVLARRGIDRPDVRAAIVGVTRHPDAVQRRAALVSLLTLRGTTLDDISRERLGELLQDTDGSVRTHAAVLLARVGGADPATADLLQQLLGEAEPGFALAGAIGLLHLVGGKEAHAEKSLPVVQRALGSRDRDTLLNALAAAQLLGEQAASILPTLVEMARVAREDREVAASICRTLSGLGPAARSAIPTLVELLEDHDPQLREEAVMAIGHIGASTAEALAPLLQLIDSGAHGMLRAAAIFALGHLEPRSKLGPALPVLIEALESSSRDERLVAGRVLGDLGPRAHKALSALKAARAATQDQEERGLFTWAIRQIQPDQA